MKRFPLQSGPGINVAFPDLASEGHVWLQAPVELNHRQLSLRGASFHGDDHVGCSILCCRGPRRMDDQVQRWRIRSLRKPRRGVRLRKSLPHKSSAHGASAPMCAWWMMTAASDRNGPTIGIIICSGAHHSLWRLPGAATSMDAQAIGRCDSRRNSLASPRSPICHQLVTGHAEELSRE